MQPVGPETAFEVAEPWDHWDRKEETPLKVDMSQQMWDYKNRGTYEGIKVDKDAQGLLVNSTQQLQQALQLKTDSGVWTGYISPQESDKKALQEYGQLKQKEVQGSVYILQQNVQFCPSLNKFLILITYVNTELGLNPRYKHLKEGSNG